MASDIFKILSRSTKLSKASKQQAAPKIPSSSEAHPQIFGQATLHAAAGTRPAAADEEGHGIQTKKRKRRPQSLEELPAALDFFGAGERKKDAPTAQGADDDSDSQEVAAENGESAAIQAFHSSPRPVTAMSEDECKSILRSHKLKVHVLEDWKSANTGEAEAEKKRQKQKSRERNEAEAPTKKQPKVQLFPQPLMSFHELRSRYNISRRLAENIEEQGYVMPTEVQMAAIPLLLRENATAPNTESAGRLASPDLLSVAPTGSGKTLAFLIPVMDAIMRARSQHATLDQPSGPLAIVLAPTKELAGQITNEGRKLAARTGIKVAMMDKTMRLFDASDHEDEAGSVSSSEGEGSDAREQEHRKRKRRRSTTQVKSHIIVSTPLTLVHAITSEASSTTRPLPAVQHLVLDEADVLLDPLFRPQTLSIWSACTSPSLSTTLWSATMGSNIESLVRSTLESRHHPPPASSPSLPRPLLRLIVGLKDTALPTISHRLVYAANEAGKLLAIRQLLHPTAPSSAGSAKDAAPLRPPFLIFTQTIPRAVALAAELRYDIPASAGGGLSRIAALHAGLGDAQRDAVMARFRRGDVWVLVTTDLLARGVDFRGVNGVVNYDCPSSAAAYIHRVGRTGRAGREGGVAVTLYAKEDVPFVRGVANVIAASEGGGGSAASEAKAWLLEKLPTPSRREKKRLKMRGVEARRPGNEDGRVRITTKSGFDRRIERRRRDAVRAAKERRQREPQPGSGQESDFEGFPD